MKESAPLSAQVASLGLQLPSPITPIQHPILEKQQVQLFIKRDELIHPLIQGNKWRKLKYNLHTAITQGHDTLLSFGGAYSNHLHALAAIGYASNLKTIGVIRGEKPAKSNPCLQDMQNWNMQLHYVSRQQYRDKQNPEFIQSLKQKFGDFFLIPEGGNNRWGQQGCTELLQEVNQQTKAPYDYICCEVGSGAMLSALINANKQTQTQFLGFVVMKNRELEKDIRNNCHSNTQQNWQLNHDYHFGGFAKTNETLNQFIRDFKKEHDVQLEPVYSGKMLFGLLDMIEKNHFTAGSRILAIHGGGLQGIRGYPELITT